MRTQRELAVALSKLTIFTHPNPKDEQYPTDGDTAAQMLWLAHQLGDIAGKNVIDQGAGTGILGIGALLLGAQHVTFIERDPAAIAILRTNLEDLPPTTVVCADISTTDIRGDTILQNPPFGTREKGADLAFVQHALPRCTTLYTLHKTSTLAHLRRAIAPHGTITHEIPAQLPLRSTMPHHTRRIQRIEVTWLRIESFK